MKTKIQKKVHNVNYPSGGATEFTKDKTIANYILKTISGICSPLKHTTSLLTNIHYESFATSPHELHKATSSEVQEGINST